MPLDPSIALGIKPPQLVGAADLLSLQNVARQNQLGQLQIEDATRARSEQDALRMALRDPGSMDPATGTISLQGLQKAYAASPEGGMKLATQRQTSLKNVAELGKLEAETQRMRLESAEKQMGLGAKAYEAGAIAYDQAKARGIPEELAVAAGRNALLSAIDDLEKSGAASLAGVTPERLAKARSENGDPATWKSRVQTYTQFLADLRAQQGQDITKRGQDITASTAAAGQAVTMRGQNMTASTAAAGQVIDRERIAQGRKTYDAERGVVVNTDTGAATPVTQGGAPLPAKLSEAQKKELSTIDAQVATIKGALKDVEATPSAFGLRRGMATMAGALPESIAGRMDSSEERGARSMVFNVVSKVINERAGAAQSAQELARLRSFLPAETDNDSQVKDKLNAFEKYLGSQREAWSKPQGGAPGAASVQKEVEGAGWSYEPSKYEYRVVDGKVQRKLKNG